MTRCDLCNKPAVYHDTRIYNGVTKTTNLCEEHAREAGVDISPHGFSISISPESLGFSQKPAILACPDCGLTLADYKESSLLGCPECYNSFGEKLLTLISSMQENHTKHVGRAPRRANPTVSRHIAIRSLLADLEKALNHEAYEEAAAIRDTLKELHNKGESNEN
ncbi:MAG: UvrB/UvrC motif-containing protein [Phycisphaerales bacterium]|jgi:protein arginine kinase activator|nr:UvrB/UvrC motif-containing protein [Phycisphaerales bacterium]